MQRFGISALGGVAASAKAAAERQSQTALNILRPHGHIAAEHVPVASHMRGAEASQMRTAEGLGVLRILCPAGWQVRLH